MEQILARLLTEINAMQERMEAKIDINRENMLARMDGNQEKIDAKMDANQEKKDSRYTPIKKGWKPRWTPSREANGDNVRWPRKDESLSRKDGGHGFRVKSRRERARVGASGSP
jgi:hypothetical protein